MLVVEALRELGRERAARRQARDVAHQHVKRHDPKCGVHRGGDVRHRLRERLVPAQNSAVDEPRDDRSRHRLRIGAEMEFVVLEQRRVAIDSPSARDGDRDSPIVDDRRAHPGYSMRAADALEVGREGRVGSNGGGRPLTRAADGEHRSGRKLQHFRGSGRPVQQSRLLRGSLIPRTTVERGVRGGEGGQP